MFEILTFKTRPKKFADAESARPSVLYPSLRSRSITETVKGVTKSCICAPCASVALPKCLKLLLFRLYFIAFFPPTFLSGASPRPFYCSWCWLVCVRNFVAVWFVSGSFMLFSGWSSRGFVMFGSFKALGLVLYTLKAGYQDFFTLRLSSSSSSAVFMVWISQIYWHLP